MLDFFLAKFFRYPLPLSEVISSFLFLRNTFQFLGRHSKCDVWRVSHHWETGKTWQNKCFERKSLKCPQSLRERCAIKTVCTFLYKSCEKRWFPGKFWIWALVAAFSSVWDVYWCNHIQALTFRAGSQTPSLDSKMCQFPRISLSELWKARSFRLILHQGLLASPFCVGFLSKTVSKWSFWAGCWIPALVAISFKNKPGIICPGQNLILEAQIFPFDGKHNMMVPPTFSFAGFGDTLAPRPIWTTVSWNNNGDLAGFHWALAVTTGGYNGILVLSSPLHTYIYTINQYIHIYI